MFSKVPCHISHIAANSNEGFHHQNLLREQRTNACPMTSLKNKPVSRNHGKAAAPCKGILRILMGSQAIVAAFPQSLTHEPRPFASSFVHRHKIRMGMPVHSSSHFLLKSSIVWAIAGEVKTINRAAQSSTMERASNRNA